jgi:hypothetical protein
MKRRNSGNNGYIGIDETTNQNSGRITANKIYNTGVRELPYWSFGNTANTFSIPGPNYQRPIEWPALPSVTAGSQQISGLFAVFNNESNICAVQIQGAYNVDWGDGTTGAFASNAVATKRYDQTTYAALTSSIVASRGNNYKTTLIRITPQTGNTFTTVDFCATPTGITGLNALHSSQWLDIRMSAPNLTTLVVSKWFFNSISNRMLELFEFVGQSALTSFSFISSFSLQKIVAFPSTSTMGSVSWQSIFHTCYSLQELPASIFDGIRRATNIAYLFYICSNLKKIPVDAFNLSNCTSVEGTFIECKQLKRIPALINTQNVTSFSSTFSGCGSIDEVPFLDTTRCTNFSSMFVGTRNLLKIQDSFAGASGTNFSYMFSNTCLTNLPTINTSNGTNFQGMINSSNVETIPEYTYSKATDLSFFARFSALLKYVPQFNTSSSLTNTSRMFDNCFSLISAPVISNMSAVTDTSFMFQSCQSLKTIPGITLGNVATSTSMFNGTQTLSSVGLIGASFSFSLANNVLGPTALNQIYTNLATVGLSGSNARTLTVSGNWGYTASNRTIAIGKGWAVI